MTRRHIPVLILLLLLSAAGLSAVSFEFSRAELLEIIDTSPVREGIGRSGDLFVEGYSLMEVLPLMENVETFEFRASEGTRILRGGIPAAEWAEFRLIPAGDGLDLLIRGSIHSDLQSLTFTGTPMESDELEVWLSWEGGAELRAELERFARLHRLDIRIVEVPNPDSKLVSVVRARGDVPDVVMIQSSAVENLVRNRAVQALDYLDLAGLNPGGLTAFTVDERLRAAPFYFDTQVFVANPLLVDLERRPVRPGWSTGDLERLAGSVSGNNVYPLVWNAYSSNWLIPFQASFGKNHLLNPDGTITVDDRPTARALEYILDLRDRELLEPMERDAMDALFIAGRIGIIMTGSYSIPYFESLGIPFEVLPMPVNGETGEHVSPLLDFKGFCITRRTKAPLLAARVVLFLSSTGVQQRYCTALDKLPARTEIMDLPGSESSHLEILRTAAETGTVIPPQQVYRVYKNNMWKLLRFTLSGRMSPEETLRQGQRLMDAYNQGETND